MDYFNIYREMISLRGLTDHTLTSYSTYIRSYLDYLHSVLHKLPEEVSWDELRDFIRWLQKNRSLSDRTINACISQLRFFTIYVLHKPWDPTQLPIRKFDSYLPFVPTKKEVHTFISTLSDPKPKAMVALMYSAGLRVSEVCNLRYCDIERKTMRIHVARSKSRSDRYAILSQKALDLLTLPSIPFTLQDICVPMKNFSAGNTGSPAILSGMPLELTFMKTGPTCLPSKISWDTSP